MSVEAKHRIAHVVVVRYLDIVEDDVVLYLSRISDYTGGSDYGISSDEGTRADFCIRSDDAWTDDSVCRLI